MHRRLRRGLTRSRHRRNQRCCSGEDQEGHERPVCQASPTKSPDPQVSRSLPSHLENSLSLATNDGCVSCVEMRSQPATHTGPGVDGAEHPVQMTSLGEPTCVGRPILLQYERYLGARVHRGRAGPCGAPRQVLTSPRRPRSAKTVISSSPSSSPEARSTWRAWRIRTTPSRRCCDPRRCSGEHAGAGGLGQLGSFPSRG